MRIICKLGIVAGVLCSILGTQGCSKYLDKNASNNYQLPNSIPAIQGMLNNHILLQEQDPSLLDRVTDEFYVPGERWAQMDPEDKAAYKWEGNMYPVNRTHEWGQIYQRVFVANVALAGLDKLIVQAAEQNDWKKAKGSAQFIRGRALQQAAFLWAPAYNPVTSDKDKGIALRLTDDVNEKITRSSVEHTYQQIVADLKSAASLLPVYRLDPLEPSAPAANAYLARTYLAMGQYDSCLEYSNRAIGKYAMFFNLAEPNNPYINEDHAYVAFKRFNPEVLFDAVANYATIIGFGGGIVDSSLYALYHPKDLRRKYFFAPTGDFTGDYNGGGQTFSGIACDEVYLMRAECLVRTGKPTEGIDVLNDFLNSKFNYGDNVPYPNDDPGMALQYVLQERYKELLRRGVRWMDIKRLNREGRDIRLKRIIDGKTITLEPNSPNYALPIPDDVIKMTGIEQN